ncbi:hypothetical protein EYF80_026259 [Liparis tanakae]|uniref:Uncharacterized protein n=1 Tax=Liparis tanakae TaxID=230148 RepID=A0A4Z2HCA7_9TELE|nr:hypothetical protein EYF80_026259 [Liparis tanakae]
MWKDSDLSVVWEKEEEEEEVGIQKDTTVSSFLSTQASPRQTLLCNHQQDDRYCSLVARSGSSSVPGTGSDIVYVRFKHRLLSLPFVPRGFTDGEAASVVGQKMDVTHVEAFPGSRVLRDSAGPTERRTGGVKERSDRGVDRRGCGLVGFEGKGWRKRFVTAEIRIHTAPMRVPSFPEGKSTGPMTK